MRQEVERFEVIPTGAGECKLKVECIGDTADVEAVAKWLRSLPTDQKPFFKECRLKAIIPVYLPKGDFESDVTANNMDKDQLSWLLKNRPEFSAVDETRNNTIATGRKIIVGV